MNPNAIVAYLVLFSATGFLFLFAALLFGRFLRPYAGTPEKLQTYECGEPSVGTSYVQFDLRFYVVALVFIIFEVEVAFFFPWATVFGKATQAAALATAAEALEGSKAAPQQEALLKATVAKYRELGANTSSRLQNVDQPVGTARTLAKLAMLDMAAFFGIVLIGFAYVWNRGDLDWVRAVGRRGVGDEADGPPFEIGVGAGSQGISS